MDKNGGTFFRLLRPALPKQRRVRSRFVNDRVELTPAIIVVNMIASWAPGPVKRSELENGVMKVHPAVVKVGLLHRSSLMVVGFSQVLFMNERQPARPSRVGAASVMLLGADRGGFGTSGCGKGLSVRSMHPPRFFESMYLHLTVSRRKVWYLLDSIYTG